MTKEEKDKLALMKTNNEIDEELYQKILDIMSTAKWVDDGKHYGKPFRKCIHCGASRLNFGQVDKFCPNCGFEMLP